MRGKGCNMTTIEYFIAVWFTEEPLLRMENRPDCSTADGNAGMYCFEKSPHSDRNRHRKGTVLVYHHVPMTVSKFYSPDFPNPRNGEQSEIQTSDHDTKRPIHINNMHIA
uniref:Uncharacterized protein n=1 Tax=Wuchereria bancrofti TaxID=6293 RepID=A0AAF5Q1G3_WUCBA